MACSSGGPCIHPPPLPPPLPPPPHTAHAAFAFPQQPHPEPPRFPRTCASSAAVSLGLSQGLTSGQVFTALRVSSVNSPAIFTTAGRSAASDMRAAILSPTSRSLRRRALQAVVVGEEGGMWLGGL